MSAYKLEMDAFQKFVRGERIPLLWMALLGIKSIAMLFEGALRLIPGGIGITLRYFYYKPFLKHLGKNVIIDAGVYLNGARNISLGDYCWIDVNTRIEAYLGPVTIGKRVHVAPGAIIAAREPVIIKDYAGISAGAKIYAGSEAPIGGRRMSGPMVPEEHKAVRAKAITMEKDSFVGANSILLPGAMLAEGCVVGANCVVSGPLEAYGIYAGNPLRKIRVRETVNVPDL